MSIATLKKKSNTLHGSFHSSGTGGFSLHGIYRNPSYIGRTSHSQHNPRTLMKGTEARGSGGCCGTYREVDLVRPVSTLTTEDTTVLKTASKTTTGMIAMRYRWIRRPYPYSIQKTYTAPMTAYQKCAAKKLAACDDSTTIITPTKPICGY